MDIKTKKHLSLLFFAVFAFLFSFSLCHQAAAYEILDNVPDLPGAPKPTNLPQLVNYIFRLGIYLTGFLALISFAIGAITFMASMSNVELASSGKDRMKGSIFGLGLSAIAWLLLVTVNQAMTIQTISPLPSVSGIFYSNGNEKENTPCPTQESNTVSVLNDGYKAITYKCDNNSNGNLLIWEYPLPNFLGTGNNFEGVTVSKLACGGTESIGDVASFIITLDSPGVYYCLGGCDGDMCEGYMSSVTTADNTIPEPFKQKVKGVRIINEGSGQHGIIFHDGENQNDGGKCTEPIISKGASGCYDVTDFSAASATIFSVNNTPSSSGKGVSFFSEPYGWDTGARAGFNEFKTVAKPFSKLAAKEMKFKYDNVDRPASYKFKCETDENGDVTDDGALDEFTGFCSEYACETFQDCPGSMWLNGNYIVGLYSDYVDESSFYCQTFKANIPNLNAQQFIASGGNYVDSVYVIPIQ